MSAEYHKLPSTGITQAMATLESSSPRKPNQWNDFQKQLKGSGLNSEAIRTLYHQLKNGQSSVSNPPMFPMITLPDDWAMEYMEQTLERQDFAQCNTEAPVPAVQPTQLAEIAIADLKLRPKGIGKGAFGEVFAATFRGTPVAVKVVVVSSKQAVKTFTTELASLSSLNHPNIVSFYGYVEVERGKFGLVMEFMAGGSLWDKLHGVEEGEALSSTQKLSIASQVTSALEYVHDEAHGAHRDIKSRNILLSLARDAGSPIIAKLCDFGFIQLRNQAQSSMASHGEGVFVGTPAYAAPEAFAEKVSDQDVVSWARCDVFSLAVVLWELFEEDEPHFGMSPVAIKTFVLAGNRPAFSKTAANVQCLITSAWAQDPSARTTAHQLHSALFS